MGDPASGDPAPGAPAPAERAAGSAASVTGVHRRAGPPLDGPLDGRLDGPLDGRLDERLPALVLAAAVIVFSVVFCSLVRLRHDRLGSFDFDMGIQDQSVWLLAHLRGFLTVRGLQVFGHHATPGYFLFVPAYWLGAGPDFLNCTQVVVAALGAVPVYLLARTRTGRPWLGLAFGVAYLLHPALQFFMQELFHPEVMAITPLLCAYYCSVRRRWGWFAVFCILAVCWKEDVALAVVVLGLIVALRGDRKVGLWTAAGALAWFATWTLVVFPLLDHGAIQSAGLYRDVGGSPTGILRTGLTDPSRLTAKLWSGDARDYLWRLTAPFGLLAFAAPLVLAVGVPQGVLNLVTNVPWTKTITFHYAAIPLVAVVLASVEGGCWIVRRGARRWVAVAVGVAVVGWALATSMAWGPSPVGAEYRTGIWPLEAPRAAAGRALLDHIPGDAPVSASDTLVPHLTHRPEVYTFPNPWRSSNFGIDGWPKRSPATVRWILLDETLTQAEDRALFEQLVASGRFRIVASRDGYVLARRVSRPGTR